MIIEENLIDLTNKKLEQLYSDQNISEKSKRLYLLLFLCIEKQEILNLKEILYYSNLSFQEFENCLIELSRYLRVKVINKRVKFYKFNFSKKIIIVKVKKSQESVDAIKIVKAFYKFSKGASPNFAKEVGIITNQLKKFSKDQVIFALKWCLKNKSDKMYHLALFPYLINEALKHYDTKTDKQLISLKHVKEYIVRHKLGLVKSVDDYEKTIKRHNIQLDHAEFKRIKERLGH